MLIDNPYVRPVSPRQLSVTAGESVTLEFSAAVDSNGLTWSREDVNFTFTDLSGVVTSVNSTFLIADQNFPHNFFYMIERVNRSHDGVYTATASSMCNIVYWYGNIFSQSFAFIATRNNTMS